MTSPVSEMTLRLALLKPFSKYDRRYLIDQLAEHYEFIEPKAFDDVTIAGVIADADAALGTDIPLTVLEQARQLKLLQVPATGVNGLDLAALAKQGVAVCNSHSSAPYVAEHAVAMLLNLIKRVSLHDRLMRKGEWFRPTGKPNDVDFMSGSLMGATIGLIGFGHVGKNVTQLLSGFQPRFLATVCQTEKKRKPISKTITAQIVPLDELLCEANAVIISVPLTHSTRGLIDQKAIAKLQNNAFLINVARAGVIDMQALNIALQQRQLGGAAIDVWDDGATDPFIKKFATSPNTILSPHRAGTLADFGRHLKDAVQNLTAFATGGDLQNRVNHETGY